MPRRDGLCCPQRGTGHVALRQIHFVSAGQNS